MMPYARTRVLSSKNYHHLSTFEYMVTMSPPTPRECRPPTQTGPFGLAGCLREGGAMGATKPWPSPK